ncbi:MAG: nucleotidyltransferase domain-containing protein [Acidobacteria bacterium]|nr:nucleotidyltransferase domain-containing protein [Acidobacteriota bacterium]
MRWTRPLDDILGSRAKLRVLRVLARASEPLSGREVGRRARLSHTGALKVLGDLAAHEVVWPASGPGGVRYRINGRHHLVRGGLLPLLEVERSLERRLTETLLERVPDALSVVLFGSAARGDDRPQSDLDVLIVVPDGTDPDEAADAIAAADLFPEFGKTIAPVVWTVSMLRRRSRQRLPLLRAVAEEGRVLAGESLDALLHGGRRAAG